MFKIGLSMKLRQGQVRAYIQAHRNLWPDVDASMRENGVNMVIFRHDHDLFLFATAPTQEDWARSRASTALHGWNAQMTRHLQTDVHGNIQFTLLDEVFAFGEFRNSPQA